MARRKKEDKTSTEDLKQAIASAKKEASKNPPTETVADRVRNLANRVKDLPGFSLGEFLRITKIGDQTWRTWINQGVSRPHDVTLDALRRYLRIKPSIFDRYISGNVDLDELWENRNTDVAKADVDRLVNGFRLLPIEDKLEVLGKLPNLLNDEYRSLNEVLDGLRQENSQLAQELEAAKKPKPIETIELSSESRKRLRELLRMTMMFKGQTEQDLIKLGADGALIESIQEDTADKYPKESFVGLAQVLCVPIQWSNNLPVIDPNALFGDDVKELLKEIEATAS